MTVRTSLLFAARLIMPRTAKQSNARRSLVGACACIGISLVPLVMVLTVSNGMIEGIKSRMIGLSSSHIECRLASESEPATSLEALMALSARLQAVDGVVETYPELQSVALAASAKGRTGATVRAVREGIFHENTAFATLFEVVEGEIPQGVAEAGDSARNGSVAAPAPALRAAVGARYAVIGEKLAATLDLHAGSTFRLITTRTGDSGAVVPKITPFKVAAIVSSGYQELDALWVFIPLEAGFSILSAPQASVKIGIEARDGFSPELSVTAHRVQNLLPQFSRAYLWNELNTAEYENFSSTQMMLLFIMLLILLVASVNISSALVMLVMERRREIAILKSLGATADGITLSFLITGMVAGLFGVLVGLPTGLLCAVNINKIIAFIEKVVNLFAKFVYLMIHGSAADLAHINLLDPAFYLQHIPLSIPLGELSLIVVGTLMLSLLVSAVPAIRAGREKPIDTLRKL